MSIPTPIEWQEGRLKILDQTLLPHQTSWIELETIEDVFEAIIQLKVRGAPAIGITAAYGLAIAAKNTKVSTSKLSILEFMKIIFILRVLGRQPLICSGLWIE